MVVTAKELRLNTSQVLKKVQQVGSITITFRGKPVAKLLSTSPAKNKKLTDYAAIGMWKDREDMKDVDAWVRKVRKPRFFR